MLPPQNPNRFFIDPTLHIGQLKQGNRIASKSFPQISNPNFLVVNLAGDGVGQKGAKIVEGVGDGVAEVDNISIVVEFILKRKVVKGLLAYLSPQLVALFIVDFGSISDPSDLSSLEPCH